MIGRKLLKCPHPQDSSTGPSVSGISTMPGFAKVCLKEPIPLDDVGVYVKNIPGVVAVGKRAKADIHYSDHVAKIRYTCSDSWPHWLKVGATDYQSRRRKALSWWVVVVVVVVVVLVEIVL